MTAHSILRADLARAAVAKHTAQHDSPNSAADSIGIGRDKWLAIVADPDSIPFGVLTRMLKLPTEAPYYVPPPFDLHGDAVLAGLTPQANHANVVLEGLRLALTKGSPASPARAARVREFMAEPKPLSADWVRGFISRHGTPDTRTLALERANTLPDMAVALIAQRLVAAIVAHNDPTARRRVGRPPRVTPRHAPSAKRWRMPAKRTGSKASLTRSPLHVAEQVTWNALRGALWRDYAACTALRHGIHDDTQALAVIHKHVFALRDSAVLDELSASPGTLTALLQDFADQMTERQPPGPKPKG